MVGDGVAVLVARAFAALDRQPDAAALADFMADYIAHIAVESRLYPNVLPVLIGLARDGWRLAVCTNKPERAARSLLQTLGVLPLLCAVGGGDSFSTRKPDPAHLLATLARAAGTPESAAHARRPSQRRRWRRAAPGYRPSSPCGGTVRPTWRMAARQSPVTSPRPR